MKKLNITKERFEKSRYFQKKYGKLKYVSESGKLFKTSKGKVLKFNESVNASMEYALSDWEDDFNESHGLEGNDKLNLGFYIGFDTPGMFSIWATIGFDGEQYMEEAVNELVQKFGLKKIGDIGDEGGGVVQYFEWDIDKYGIPEMNYFSFMTDKGWTDEPGEILEGMLEYGYNVWDPAMRELFKPSK
jgi:hypothetical protein